MSDDTSAESGTALEKRFHHVVAAILVDADKILFVHRSPTRDWAPDTWDVPGGHIEAGESQAEAMRREVREELGVEVATRSLARFAQLRGPNWEVAYFRIEAWSGALSNAAPHEHTELRWLTLVEVSGLQLADPAVLPILNEALA